MIEGFDKEIDSLLRRAATGESVQTFDRQHLDADEISLFAENALTTRARTRATHHLAECAKCRKILSNLISFNAEAESEIIHAEEKAGAIVAAAPVIPWYRRLFAFPQITFAMGALALVFAGVIAVMVVLQNSGDMQNATVARREEITEKSRGTGGASSDGESQTVENYASNSANSTSAIPAAPFNPGMTTGNTATNSTGTNTAATTANTTVTAAQRPQMPNNEPLKPEQQKPLESAEQQPQPPPPVTTLNKSADTAVGPPAPKDARQQRAEEEAKEDAPRKREADRDALNDSPKLGRTQAETTMRSPASRKAAGEDKNKAGESRAVGGKTFRNVGGIWFDSAYTSQQPTMIRRGSNDYKRLDSGLRSIAESLGGTIVVLWKGKAYRIN